MNLNISVEQHRRGFTMVPGQFKCTADIMRNTQCVHTTTSITSGSGIEEFTTEAINKYEEILKAES